MHSQMPGVCPGGGCWSFELIGALLDRFRIQFMWFIVSVENLACNVRNASEKAHFVSKVACLKRFVRSEIKLFFLDVTRTRNGEPGTGNWELGTGNREQGTGNREQGTGNREQGTGNREQGTGNREQGTGNREQGTGNREQGTGNREQGTGNREQGTGNREQGSGNERSAVFHIKIQNGGWENSPEEKRIDKEPQK